jgi:iron-sulfur cluster insertion protein
MASFEPISITESAAARVSAILESQDNADLMLRINVAGGGCSGFQYGFDLDGQVGAGDHVFEAENGIKVVVDELSLAFLGGSEVDFVDELVGSAFRITNPNAQASCGCGSSFAV